MIRQLEEQLEQIDLQISMLRQQERTETGDLRMQQLLRDKRELLQSCRTLTPADRVYLARHAGRPTVVDYAEHLFTDFFEQKGDRLFADDGAIYGGIARFHGRSVTVIGHRKGKNLTENLACNFGMPNPEGYRKVQRLARQAEKFRRPIITFIDTPGAYPGLEAEERGQGQAIAECLALFSDLTVPVIAIVTGEGGSGGALALGVANRIFMLENAVYSVLSPEGFASILWKDSSRSGEACDIMKLTASDLQHFGIADEVIAEPIGGAHRNCEGVYTALDQAISRHLTILCRQKGSALARQRYHKFRCIGGSYDTRRN